MWKRAIKAHKFRDSGETIQKRLFCFIKPLQEALFHIRKECVQAVSRRLFSIEDTTNSPETLVAFASRRAEIQRQVAGVLRTFSATVHDAVRTPPRTRLWSSSSWRTISRRITR